MLMRFTVLGQLLLELSAALIIGGLGFAAGMGNIGGCLLLAGTCSLQFETHFLQFSSHSLIVAVSHFLRTCFRCRFWPFL